MPVDYSKWDNLELSDDEEEKKAPPPKRGAAKKEEAVKPPKQATGSAWNANNYHWEEQKLDAWGKERLQQLFAATEKAHEEIDFKGQRLSFGYNYKVSTLEGDAWTHIRKGKTVVGYNFEIVLTFSGKIKTSSREEHVAGELTADVMVDDDADVNIDIKEGSDLPFVSSVKQCVKSEFNRRIGKFVQELGQKAQVQREKTEQLAQEASKVAAVAQQEQAKSHFGGRVQVGGHVAKGLRIS